MPRQKEPLKPIFPLKHEFDATLDEYLHRANMLATVVRICLQTDAIDKRVADKVREQLAAFDEIAHAAE